MAGTEKGRAELTFISDQFRKMDAETQRRFVDFLSGVEFARTYIARNQGGTEMPQQAAGEAMTA